jgi:hypothetical protein
VRERFPDQQPDQQSEKEAASPEPDRSPEDERIPGKEVHVREGPMETVVAEPIDLTSSTLDQAETVYIAPPVTPQPAQPLISEEQAKRERRRAQSRESSKRYYQRLKERAAAGDAKAQEILEKNRAIRRETVKQWAKDNPERHRQHSKKWSQSERGKQYQRELMRKRRARQKSENSQS